MTLLQTQNLSAFYGDFQALFGINVTVEQGETVAIIGANGAGKTTFLRAVAGAIESAPEMIMFDGLPIGHKTPHEIVRLGIAMVPEGRRLFPSLSVEENLLLGTHSERVRDHGRSSASMSFSRGSMTYVTSLRLRCQVASSKWRQWAAV